MSHFTVLVIGENPEEQLAPFCENLEVPRYVKYTRQQIIDIERESIKRYAETTYKMYLDNPTEYAKGSSDVHLNYLKNEFPKRLQWNDEQLYQEGIRYESADDIGPDGEVYSTSNPNSKWDWYQLGGRWAGSIKVKEGVKFERPNFSWGWDMDSIEEMLATRSTDSAIKKNIENLDDLCTFAVLKDGKWYERGEMGWWGMVSNEKDENEWNDQVLKLIHSLSDDTLLSVYDCHI